jgi:hypothetical protein
MKPMVQSPLPPMEVKGLDGDQWARGSKVQKLDDASITLDMAKAQLGRAIQKTIFRTNSVLKDFGDPSRVKRVCEGDISEVFARAWQRHDRRREFLRALAEEEASVLVETIYRFKETA